MLAERDVSVAVAFASGDESLADRAYAAPALSQSSRRAEASGFRQLAQILEIEKPDVVHLHNIFNVGAIEACLQAAPVVVTGHDYRYLCPASTFYFRATEQICERDCAGLGCFTTTLRKRCLSPRPKYALAYYRRARWFARNASRFAGLIAPCEYAAGRFRRAGFPEDRAIVLPYYCSLAPRDEPRPLPSAPTVLYMGRLSANKGYRQFVQALGTLPKDVRGVLIGNFTPDKQQEVDQLAKASGCHERLECRGWAERHEIESVFSQTTAFVFPSLWAETLGIVGLEALAMGVPVASSDVGGAREWLLDGVTGFFAPPGDAAGLARAMGRLVEDPQLNRRLGLAGIELIRKRFLPERHVETLLDFYQRAASSPFASGAAASGGAASADFAAAHA
jgi:glycosyltransferase involved in cell wall biosynthesis